MENYAFVKENIEKLRAYLNGSGTGVKLLAVTKFFPPEAVREAIRCGLTEFGESKIQEAADKIPGINSEFSGIKWHDIGHLQGNKINKAVGLFNCIQSVDSLKLAEKISSACAAGNIEIEILLELKVSTEPAKTGFPESGITAAAEKICVLPGLKLKGLMAMAPASAEKEDARPYFKKAREIFEGLKKSLPGAAFDTLSMGMTDDYTVAVEEGSTMVRIGTGIFGRRNY
jgi:PLP dependent protein